MLKYTESIDRSGFHSHDDRTKADRFEASGVSGLIFYWGEVTFRTYE